MKYLKYLFFAVLALVVIFLGKGLLTPSVSYDCEVTVNKAAVEAWAVMSDESKLAEWIEGYKRGELVSGTAGTVGAVSNIYVEENGEEMVMQETITALKPNELMAMTFTMDFMDMDYEIAFDEKEGNTQIRTKSVVSGNGMMAKSIVSFITSAMIEQEEKNLNNLKKIIEENTKDYFPPSEAVEIEEETSAEM
ncbi:MAG: SRPBCC family protein [Reichenbachiella sp.]|uniref:SRPBCC family protein n=1 Tax=Reichenbachiella sp. TaxID=2184521 RepID=UPI0032975507